MYHVSTVLIDVQNIPLCSLSLCSFSIEDMAEWLSSKIHPQSACRGYQTAETRNITRDTALRSGHSGVEYSKLAMIPWINSFLRQLLDQSTQVKGNRQKMVLIPGSREMLIWSGTGVLWNRLDFPVLNNTEQSFAYFYSTVLGRSPYPRFWGGRCPSWAVLAVSSAR